MCSCSLLLDVNQSHAQVLLIQCHLWKQPFRLLAGGELILVLLLFAKNVGISMLACIFELQASAMSASQSLIYKTALETELTKCSLGQDRKNKAMTVECLFCSSVVVYVSSVGVAV